MPETWQMDFRIGIEYLPKYWYITNYYLSFPTIMEESNMGVIKYCSMKAIVPCDRKGWWDAGDHQKADWRLKRLRKFGDLSEV